MKFVLLTVLLGLACSATAGGKLSNRKAQIAVLKTLEKVGLLEANIHLKMASLPSIKAIKHNNVMVDIVQATLIQLELREDLTPLEALRQQKEDSGWKSNEGIFGFFSSRSTENKRTVTIDVLINLLEDNKKLLGFLQHYHEDNLVPNTENLALPNN